MKEVLIDTDILPLFFRNQPIVVRRFKKYLSTYKSINISIITYYEILSGLKYRDAKKQLELFLDFSKYNTILPLTQESIEVSSEIYANLRQKGKIIDDIDILIAGIGLVNNLAIVTHNEKHFKNIEGVEVIDWTK